MRTQLQVAIFRQAPVIASAQLHAVGARYAQTGDQHTGTGPAIGAQLQRGKRQDALAEKREISAFEPHPVGIGIVDDALGSDLPAGALRAAFRGGDGTAGIGAAHQRDPPVVGPLSAFGRQPPAFAQHQQQIAQCAGFELVGQLQLAGVELVSVAIHVAHIATRIDPAGGAIPADFVGPHGPVPVAQQHVAAREDDVLVRIIFERVGLESDLALAAGRRRIGAVDIIGDRLFHAIILLVGIGTILRAGRGRQGERRQRGQAHAAEQKGAMRC